MDLPSQAGWECSADGVAFATASAGKADSPEKTEPSSADKLGIEQQAIADNFQRLEDVLLRMAELSETTDPSRAVLLRKTVRQSEERLIGVQLDTLVDLLAKACRHAI